MKHTLRIITASILWNALEFYNLTLYGALTSALYFLSDKPSLSLLASLAAFGVAFLALSISIVLMGIPTVAITFLLGHGRPFF